MLKEKIFGIVLTVLLISIATFTFTLNIQTVRAESRTWTVDDDGTADFTTIQEAINTANSGDTIFVHAGTYYEHLTIGKSLSLVGEDKHNTVIDGNLTGHVINVTASNVKITGFTIQRSYQYTPGYGIYIAAYSTNNNITHNIITNNERSIRLDHSSNNIISRNNITKNKGGVILDESSNNMISGNTIEKHEGYGIIMSGCQNFVIGNNITSNVCGIFVSSRGGNIISRNNIVNNTRKGICITISKDNVFCENNIIANEYGVYEFLNSSNNVFHHNNFIDNTYQVDYGMEGVNIWDNGYPSGGNYWSDFDECYPDVEDVYSGPHQNESGSDGIWDHFYWIASGNRDNYPLVTAYIPSGHELVVFELATPASITLGGSSLVNATVTNQGSSDATNVKFLLLINGTVVDSITIPLLQVGNSHMLSYLWTPTVKGTYNVTAYAHPLPGETSVKSNQKAKFTTVWAVGVKAGDWIKYDYTITGASPRTPIPTWIKVEIVSVEGTTVSVRLTMHMSDGTEGSETLTLDVALTVYYTGGTIDTLFGFGFVIPANSTVEGDYIYIRLLSPKFTLGKQIDGKTTRTYAGASRTVVYATFSSIGGRYGGNPLNYYWDERTGVMVEASATLDGMTATAKAVETNMWETLPPEPASFPIDPLILAALIAIVIVIVIAVLLVRRKKKPTEAQKPETQP